jgi:hypothetical protein
LTLHQDQLVNQRKWPVKRRRRPSHSSERIPTTFTQQIIAQLETRVRRGVFVLICPGWSIPYCRFHITLRLPIFHARERSCPYVGVNSCLSFSSLSTHCICLVFGSNLRLFSCSFQWYQNLQDATNISFAYKTHAWHSFWVFGEGSACTGP